MVTLAYAENEVISSNPPPDDEQVSLVGHSNLTPNPAAPIRGPQFVGAPIALRQSFPASKPQPTPPLQPAMPSAGSPAPAQSSQRTNNAKDKKGKGKASPSKGNTSVPKTSRHLTQEEIWDDSALVDAWDAAMDQYRVSYISLIIHP